MDKFNHNLWIGNCHARNNVNLLASNGITTIVSIMTREERKYHIRSNLPQHIYELKLYMEDDEDAPLDQALKITNPFIDEAISNNNVILIHCVAGISRSSSVLIGYIMHAYGYSAKGALEAVRRCRPIVNPNPGFRRILGLDEMETMSMLRRNTRPNNGILKLLLRRDDEIINIVLKRQLY